MELVENIIDRDLNLVVLEKEYPDLKEALIMDYSAIGYEEIKRAINEISSKTFTAARLLARAQRKYDEYIGEEYEITYGHYRNAARKILNKEWTVKKHKSTLTEKVIDEYVMAHYSDKLLPLKKVVAKLKMDIDILKALHKRLEMRETLLQTYSRLHEKRSQVILPNKEI